MEEMSKRRNVGKEDRIEKGKTVSGWRDKTVRTVGSKSIQPPDIFPLISIVNKSCNIERCVKTILPIIQNLIVS